MSEKITMREALELVLLFHSGSAWDKQQMRWNELTGGREATTRVLCDCAREALTFPETGNQEER
jgi:hypothetical protein